MAALKYRKHQVLDGFTAFILCTKMSLCKIEEKIKKYPQTFIFICVISETFSTQTLIA